MTLASIDSLCPACEGSSRLATSHRLDGHHQVVQCSHCRLEFLVPFIREGESSGSSSSAVTWRSYIEVIHEVDGRRDLQPSDITNRLPLGGRAEIAAPVRARLLLDRPRPKAVHRVTRRLERKLLGSAAGSSLTPSI